MPSLLVMRRIIIGLLMLYSSNLFANANDLPAEVIAISPLMVMKMYDEQNKESVKDLVDLVDKEEKVSVCIDLYVKKQTKSYAKNVQNDLYDLLNNFNRIASRIYGKKQQADEIAYEDKIEALAKVQCEAYYAMGTLK